VSGGTDESHEKPQDSLCPGRDFSPVPSEYEAGVLTTRPRRSAGPHNEIRFYR
jgi:hypothetical protein